MQSVRAAGERASDAGGVVSPLSFSAAVSHFVGRREGERGNLIACLQQEKEHEQTEQKLKRNEKERKGVPLFEKMLNVVTTHSGGALWVGPSSLKLE